MNGGCPCAASLAALVAEVRDLRRQVAELRGERPDDDGGVVRAIFDVIGHRAFSARDLLNHAEAEPTGRLSAAIGDRSARSIGKLLAKAVNTPPAGYWIESASADSAGRIWQIRRLP